MYRKLTILIGLIMVGLLTTSAMAEQVGLEPVPVFTQAGVQAQVSFDSTTGLYSYNYTITNPATNTGKIGSIDIDISQPSNTLILSSAGLTIPRGRKTQTFDEAIVDFEGDNVLMIPVGMSLPLQWRGSLGGNGVAWFFGSAAPSILPGETQGGFELISRGLPTIRQIELIPEWVFLVEDHEAITPEMQQKADEIEASLPYKTKTLGPTAPPADFKPVSFIDYIIFMKHEAFTLGWITNQGIEQSLDAKLENAKMEIAQGNTNTAKNILAAFISEVEAQKDKHLTSEAYGLLKYNAQYLIEKL